MGCVQSREVCPGLTPFAFAHVLRHRSRKSSYQLEEFEISDEDASNGDPEAREASCDDEELSCLLQPPRRRSRALSVHLFNHPLARRDSTNSGFDGPVPSIGEAASIASQCSSNTNTQWSRPTAPPFPPNHYRHFGNVREEIVAKRNKYCAYLRLSPISPPGCPKEQHEEVTQFMDTLPGKETDIIDDFDEQNIPVIATDEDATDAEDFEDEETHGDQEPLLELRHEANGDLVVQVPTPLSRRSSFLGEEEGTVLLPPSLTPPPSKPSKTVRFSKGRFSHFVRKHLPRLLMSDGNRAKVRRTRKGRWRGDSEE